MATGWYSGTFYVEAVGSSGTETFEHGLDFVPDIIIGYPTSAPSAKNGFIFGGYSKRFIDLLKINDGTDYPENVGVVVFASETQGILAGSQSAGIEEEPGPAITLFGGLRNWTDTTFQLGSDSYPLRSGDIRFIYFHCDGELYGDGSVPTPMMLTSSANRGGYQVVDLKNTDFTPETPTKISNIYNLVNSNSKAVMLSGIVINGETYNDLFISLYKVDYKYTAKVYDYYIVIDEENNVTFTSNEVTTTNNYIEEDDI